MTRRIKPIQERFWEKVRIVKPDECWEWQAARRDNGYGNFSIHEGNTYITKGAHCVAYMLSVGEIPEGLWVLHTCDNKPCCNPAHLFLGTRQDNIDDMVAKNRHIKGDRHPESKFSDATIERIRQVWSQGGVNQKQLVEIFGISRSHVSNVLRRLRR